MFMHFLFAIARDIFITIYQNSESDESNKQRNQIEMKP